jgi:sulfur relay protein TusB/DsrH
MTRLHQLNQSHYQSNTEHEILLSLQQNDAILLIEEAVLKVSFDEALLRHAKSLNIKVYALEQDLTCHGITTNKVEAISTNKWLQLTSDFEKHTAW